MVQDGASPSSTPRVGRGRDDPDHGKRDLHSLGMCLSVDNMFIVSTNKLWSCFHLALGWEVPNLGKLKMFLFKFGKFNSSVCIILRGILSNRT